MLTVYQMPWKQNILRIGTWDIGSWKDGDREITGIVNKIEIRVAKLNELDWCFYLFLIQFWMLKVLQIKLDLSNINHNQQGVLSVRLTFMVFKAKISIALLIYLVVAKVNWYVLFVLHNSPLLQYQIRFS